jgi:hypothetical protein
VRWLGGGGGGVNMRLIRVKDWSLNIVSRHNFVIIQLHF